MALAAHPVHGRAGVEAEKAMPTRSPAGMLCRMVAVTGRSRQIGQGVIVPRRLPCAAGRRLFALAGHRPELFFHRAVGDQVPLVGFVLVADDDVAVTHRTGVGNRAEVAFELCAVVAGAHDGQIDGSLVVLLRLAPANEMADDGDFVDALDRPGLTKTRMPSSKLEISFQSANAVSGSMANNVASQKRGVVFMGRDFSAERGAVEQIVACSV